MHDAFGQELKVGDRVVVPMEITSIGTSQEYCNVNLTAIVPMPGENASATTLSAVNTKQTIRANDGDDARFVVAKDGSEPGLEGVVARSLGPIRRPPIDASENAPHKDPVNGGTRYTVLAKDRDDLRKRFLHHAPHGDQGQRYAEIRATILDVAEYVMERAPRSRELSLALTNLEQAMMWANAAIARNEREEKVS